MEKGIKILEEFKATALTELDTVSNYLRFFPTYNHQEFKSKWLRTAILKVIEIIMSRKIYYNTGICFRGLSTNSDIMANIVLKTFKICFDLFQHILSLL